jgi:hypothetical protein
LKSMTIYRLVGVLRCPYRRECGPDMKILCYDYEERDIEKMCLTREHFSCPEYLLKNADRSEKPASSLEL